MWLAPKIAHEGVHNANYKENPNMDMLVDEWLAYEITAEICRRHNDVNVLCLSGDLLGESRLENLLRVWLETEFEGGRHARRLEKIAEVERHWC